MKKTVIECEVDFTERFLYHIWDAQHLDSDLQTVSGKKVKVISPGRLSSEAGADFRESVISIGGEMLHGDVEIHKTTYDWQAHGHSEDPNYCRVILHVVYRHNTWQEYTVDKTGKQVEILELQNKLDDDIKRILQNYHKDIKIPKEKFCRFFADQNTETLGVVLSGYGMLRLSEKQKRFAAELYFSGFNQLTYQGILEALGYARNKFQMLQLANMISYEDLRTFYKRGMKEEEMVAVLLGAAGLLLDLPRSFPVEFVLKWKEIFARQEFYIAETGVKWHLFRIRPVNHPAIRLVQIAPLIYNSLSGSLFNDVIKLFSFPMGRLKMQEFYSRLEKLLRRHSEYLPQHYRLGRTRIDTIFINIILPLAGLYAQKNNYPELKSAVNEAYKTYRKLPENHLTRAMERYLDHTQIKIVNKKAIHQQGLLHIYNNYCRYYNCLECIEQKEKMLKKM